MPFHGAKRGNDFPLWLQLASLPLLAIVLAVLALVMERCGR